MAKCAGLRALHMPRSKNTFGPFFQPFGPSCIKGTGNFLASGMPGSGPQAIHGVVVSPNSIHITFTQCVTSKAPACASPYGLTLLVEGASVPITGAAMQTDPDDNVMLVATSATINPGDTVVWSYDDSNGCWTSCGDEVESIGDQTVNVSNTLVLAGYHFLLESGGIDILLVEEDTADTDGIILEEAA